MLMTILTCGLRRRKKPKIPHHIYVVSADGKLRRFLTPEKGIRWTWICVADAQKTLADLLPYLDSDEGLAAIDKSRMEKLAVLEVILARPPGQAAAAKAKVMPKAAVAKAVAKAVAMVKAKTRPKPVKKTAKTLKKPENMKSATRKAG